MKPIVASMSLFIVLAGCAEAPPQPTTSDVTWHLKNPVIQLAAGASEIQTSGKITVTVTPAEYLSQLTTLYKVTLVQDSSISNWGGDLLAAAGNNGNVYTYKQTVTPVLGGSDSIPYELYFDVTVDNRSESVVHPDISTASFAVNGRDLGLSHLSPYHLMIGSKPETFRIKVLEWNDLIKSGSNGTIEMGLTLRFDASTGVSFKDWKYTYRIEPIDKQSSAVTSAVRLPQQDAIHSNGLVFNCAPPLSPSEKFDLAMAVSQRCKKEVGYLNVVTGAAEIVPPLTPITN
jgi:hypothetical protein